MVGKQKPVVSRLLHFWVRMLCYSFGGHVLCWIYWYKISFYYSLRCRCKWIFLYRAVAFKWTGLKDQTVLTSAKMWRIKAIWRVSLFLRKGLPWNDFLKINTFDLLKVDNLLKKLFRQEKKNNTQHPGNWLLYPKKKKSVFSDSFSTSVLCSPSVPTSLHSPSFLFFTANSQNCFISSSDWY